MNILGWCNKEKKNINDNRKILEKNYPVGTWYRSVYGITRLSNIYIKNNNLYITIEKPMKVNNSVSGVKFFIDKEDDLNPSYLNGWIRVDEKEAEKLECSYWKTIEKDLEKRTEEMNKFYNDFIKEGEK